MLCQGAKIKKEEEEYEKEAEELKLERIFYESLNITPKSSQKYEKNKTKLVSN